MLPSPRDLGTQTWNGFQKAIAEKMPKARARQQIEGNKMKGVRYAPGEIRNGLVFFISPVTSYHKPTGLKQHIFVS